MGKVIKMFYSDAGHGWLAVKTKELIELDICDKISPYSYMKGQTTYLEEDCDASEYIRAQKERGIAVEFKDGKFQNYSPIRSYNQYC